MTDYKVLVEKEYYPLEDNKPTIGLLMMIKNEKKRLHVTLNTVVGFVDALIMFDTGSTDNTVDIIKEFSEKHKINLYLIQGNFVNFCVSRNVSLNYADKINVKYLLFLDCNDELKGGPQLREFAKFSLDQVNDGFLTCQQWFSGQMDKYYNIRFVKNKCGWRYKGSVHEWLYDSRSADGNPSHLVIRMPDEIILYQDRTQDDDKTSKRFVRDRELLLKDVADNPNNPRGFFYLAQTCQCLNLHDEALYYTKLRLEFKNNEFQQFEEERFHSYMRAGNCCFMLGHEWSDVLGWYMKAFENYLRAEPLVKIADYYRIRADAEMKQKGVEEAFKWWRTAYMFLREACELNYPEHCILFVDRGIYDYYRWHLMGIVAYRVNKMEEGKIACMKAIAYDANRINEMKKMTSNPEASINACKANMEMNEKNLKFYLDEEKKNGPGSSTNNNNSIPMIKANSGETKQKFLERTVQELKVTMPNIPVDKLQKRALLMWKKREKGNR